jgi:hypothetical protein
MRPLGRLIRYSLRQRLMLLLICVLTIVTSAVTALHSNKQQFSRLSADAVERAAKICLKNQGQILIEVVGPDAFFNQNNYKTLYSIVPLRAPA